MTHWRLAEALAFQMRYGDTAPRWIVERLGALTLTSAVRAVERFKAIAGRSDELMALTRQ